MSDLELPRESRSDEWIRLRDFCKQHGIRCEPWWTVETLRDHVESWKSDMEDADNSMGDPNP